MWSRDDGSARALQPILGDTYTLERELGGGGMSHVFLDEEAWLARRVVVKRLAPELTEGMSAAHSAVEIDEAASIPPDHGW